MLVSGILGEAQAEETQNFIAKNTVSGCGDGSTEKVFTAQPQGADFESPEST